MKLPHCLAISLLILLPACKQEKPIVTPKNVVRAVEAQAVDSGRGQAKSEYIAMLRGHVETDLSFKVGGVLELLGPPGELLDWQEGSQVSKGEILARLKQADFISSIKSARARAEQDRSQHERAIKLRAAGAVSQQELEATAASRQATEASLAQAEQALRDSVLSAPYDGVIVSRSANNGETAGVGKTVLRMADLSQMSVELGIPDRLVSRVRVGREIAIRVTSLEGATFVGRVSEVGVAAKEGSRLFRLVIKVPNPNSVLKSGMTASVALDEDKTLPPGSVLIPISALISATKPTVPNQLAVFVLDPAGRAQERPITTDDLIRSSIIVTAGLQPGDRVVTAGASTLFDGAQTELR